MCCKTLPLPHRDGKDITTVLNILPLPMDPTSHTPLTTPSSTYHHIAPLVDLDGQVSVGLHPSGKGRVHHGLRGGSDGYGLSQLCAPTPGDPGNLRCKVSYVGLLLLQSPSGYKHGEVGILHTQLSYLSIKES